jgi:hypothetical protein
LVLDLEAHERAANVAAEDSGMGGLTLEDAAEGDDGVRLVVRRE